MSLHLFSVVLHVMHDVVPCFSDEEAASQRDCIIHPCRMASQWHYQIAEPRADIESAGHIRDCLVQGQAFSLQVKMPKSLVRVPGFDS